jgi:predicted nucleic acid-binding protein
MIAYLDASVVLRVLLREARPFSGWGRWERAVSSELLGLEVRRVLDRMRIAGGLDDEALIASLESLARIEAALAVVSLTRIVLQRAAMPMATAVATLDAIHLATALMVQEASGESLTFVTHDAQQARAARTLGFEVLGI